MKLYLKISASLFSFIGLASCATLGVNGISRIPSSPSCESACNQLFKSSPAERAELGVFLVNNGPSLYTEADRAPFFRMKDRELWAATLQALKVARKAKIASKVNDGEALFVVKICSRYVEDGSTNDPTIADVVKMILAARNVTATTEAACAN